MERFISGVPRAGKTKRAVIELIELLRTTSIPIATNIALKMQPWVDGKGKAQKGLLRGLFDKYGSTFNAEHRIYLLPQNRVRRFYAWRPLRGKLWDTIQELPGDERSDFAFDADTYSNVAYFIDEAHVSHPGTVVATQKGMLVGPELLGYASQCGRCSDLCFFISQVVVNVDKRLRDVSQECWWMTNHVHLQFGPFRQADKITYRVYSTTPPLKGDQWLTKGELRYDREFIDGSYDTGAGIGVSGNTAADIGRRAKGIPIKYIWVAIVLAAAIAWTGYYAVKKSAEKYFAMGKTQGQKTAQPPAAFSAAQLASLDKMLYRIGEKTARQVWNIPTNNNTPRDPTPQTTPPLPLPTVAGWTHGTAGFAIVWTDGQISRATNLTEKGRQIIIDGETYERQNPARTEPTPKKHEKSY